MIIHVNFFSKLYTIKKLVIWHYENLDKTNRVANIIKQKIKP